MTPTSFAALHTAFMPTGAPPDMRRELGQFNMFSVGDPQAGAPPPPPRHFNRQAFYKIALLHGTGLLEFAGQAQRVGPRFLFLATPSLLYRWTPDAADYRSHFCVFTDEFLLPAKGGVLAAELPVFQPHAQPVIELTGAECQAVEAIFQKMTQELASTYTYKYDLLRTYLAELIHLVQKWQPAATPAPPAATAARLAARFAELLESQFPLAAPAAGPRLRTASDYADALAVHVVHLNRVLKEVTGHTTTALLGNRLAHEARLQLKQTTRNVSEIANLLGFTDAAHFCTFFKRHTGLTPGDFRQ